MDSSSTQPNVKYDFTRQKHNEFSASQLGIANPLNLQFNKLQQLDRTEFRQFVARKAVLEEEYWTAAWLQAESHWEDRTKERYIDNYKRKFAGKVKKEDKNVKRSVVKSVVGTLDVEQIKYGYISHVCVSKSAHRQSIATNMLYFAVSTAKSKGAEQVFVHVSRNNKPAQDLYKKMGFEVVEQATAQLSKEQTCFACIVNLNM